MVLHGSPWYSRQEIMLSFRKINLSNNYIFGLYKSPHEANRYYMNSFKSRKCAVTWGDKQKLVEVISLIRDKSINIWK